MTTDTVHAYLMNTTDVKYSQMCTNIKTCVIFTNSYAYKYSINDADKVHTHRYIN